MTNRRVPNEEDLKIAELRQEILDKFPHAEAWLKTPHHMLMGKSPEELLNAGEYEPVWQLVTSILYIGMT